jgi:hypothetical protein
MTASASWHGAMVPVSASFLGASMITGLFLTLLALVGIIAIMVWIVQLPFVALLINIGLPVCCIESS